MSKPIKDWFAKTFDDWVDEGYPEEIIPDILSGDLPMDEASRAARAAEQGYGDVLYRGHSNQNAPYSDQDMWMTSSPAVAETYGRASLSDGSSLSGVTTPLRTNAAYHGPNNLAYVRGDGKMHDKVTTNSIKNPGIEQGIIKGTDNIAEVVKDSDQYQGTHFRNIKDEFHTASSTEPSDVYNILGSRPDVKIRHANAAFHPTYRGSNIMGNADPRLLGGMVAGLTAAGLVAPEIAQRFPMPEGGNRAGWLEWVTNLADETQNSLRHTTGGVSDYFFPESANDYLKKVNKEDEEPTWSDRLWAGLDLFKVPGK